MAELFKLKPVPLSEGEAFLKACNGWRRWRGGLINDASPHKDYSVLTTDFDLLSNKLLGDGVEWLGGGENRSFRISAYDQTFSVSDKSEIEKALQEIKSLSKKTSC